jgi:hypothetical protein
MGTSVVVAGLAAALARQGRESLLVDLGGDLPTIFGAPEPEDPGLAAWSTAPSDVSADALAHLEVELAAGISLLPRGSGLLRADKADALVHALAADDRLVVADAGVPTAGSLADHLVGCDARSLLVVRACPLALRRLEASPLRPTDVVVVRDRRRTTTWRDVATAAGAPVVAELELDPAVAAAVDAGLDRRPFPRAFLRVVGGLA